MSRNRWRSRQRRAQPEVMRGKKKKSKLTLRAWLGVPTRFLLFAAAAVVSLLVTYYFTQLVPPPKVTATVQKRIDSVTGCNVYDVLIVVPDGNSLESASIMLDKPPNGFSDYRLYASIFETQMGLEIFAPSGSSRTVQGRCIFVDPANAPPPNIQVVVPQGDPPVKLIFSATQLTRRAQVSVVYDARLEPDRDIIVSGNMRYKRYGFDVDKVLTFIRQPDHHSR